MSLSCLEKQQVCNICSGLVLIHSQVCSLGLQSAWSCCVYSSSLPLPWLMINKTRLRSECVLAFVFRLMLGEESGFPWRGCLNIKAVTSQHQSRDPAAQHVQPLQPYKHTQSSSLSPVTTINTALLKGDRGMNNEPRCFLSDLPPLVETAGWLAQFHFECRFVRRDFSGNKGHRKIWSLTAHGKQTDRRHL